MKKASRNVFVERSNGNMSKTLIAYFSTSGETARLAKTLAGVTGGDLF